MDHPPGSQYRSIDYRNLRSKHQISSSMPTKSDCLDKAMVESFFSSLKLELSLDNNRQELINWNQM